MTLAADLEPRWLTEDFILTIHAELIGEFGGGSVALRDPAMLGSALARPRNKWSYDAERDLAVLAAAYCFALVKNHPFVDGNKRVGFVALAVFLDLNGVRLAAPEAGAAIMVEGLADGSFDEAALAAWIRDNTE